VALVAGGLFMGHRIVAGRAVDATVSLASEAPREAGAQTSGRLRLHVGIAHITTPVAGFRLYKTLVDRFAAALGAEPELLQPESYAAANHLLREGKLDVAFVCSGGYAAEPDAMDVLAAPVMNGKAEYNALIVVAHDSPYKMFADLRGKSFLFVEEASNTGTWYPCLRAKELGGSPGSFFGWTKYTGAHDLSVLAVAGNLADGAGISSTVFESMLVREPGLKDRVRILERSPVFPSPPVVVRKSMGQAERAKLLDVLVKLPETPEGQDILNALGCDRFVPVRNEDYAGIKRCTP
jgi:phosphonate transport system substrate-binding protein